MKNPLHGAQTDALRVLPDGVSWGRRLGHCGAMSELEGEPAPELEVDEADLLEQSTPVPDDDDDEYPFGPEDEGTDEHAADYDEDDQEEA